MPLHLQYPNLLQPLNYFAAATLLISLPFLLPFIFFAFIFILFLLVLILPFSCTFTSSWLIFKVVSLEMKYIPFFGTRFGTARSKPIKGGSKCNNFAYREKVGDLGLKDNQDCFELDHSWEFPSSDEYEEEEHKKQEDDPEADGREKLSTYEEDSWQVLVPKSRTKKEEHKTFLELLSFWRKKEKGEV